MSAQLLKLRQVCSIEKGGLNPQAYAEECFAHYSIPAFDDGSKPVIEHGLQIKSQKTAISRGTVLVSKLNPRIPRVWYVADEQPFRRICSTEFVPFKPDTSRLSPEYLAFALRQLLTGGQITGSTSAATKSRERAKPSDIAALQIPVPALDEQRRIVDLLSRAEGIVRLRRHAQQKAAALIPAIFVDMFGDPATNPKGWPTKSLRELVEFQSGGTPSKARDDYWQGDVPWVSPKDMKRMALYDAIDHINSLVLSETSLKLVPPGSVLIVVRGMILAHTVPVAEARVPLTVNQDMKAMVSKGEISSTYLLWMLQVCHDRLLAQVTTAAHGTKKLDTARLEEMVIPMPPMAVQQAFASSVQRVEAIQEHQVNAMAKADAAFQALLAREFSATGQAAVGRTQEEATA